MLTSALTVLLCLLGVAGLHGGMAARAGADLAGVAVLAGRLVLLGAPADAVAGPVALYLADVAWTLQRRIRGGERWLQAHRTHVYQRWCDAGWSHQEVTVLTSALTVLLCLLGAAGLHGGMAAQAGADLAGITVLAAYLCSPGLFLRLGMGEA